MPPTIDPQKIRDQANKQKQATTTVNGDIVGPTTTIDPKEPKKDEHVPAEKGLGS